MGQTVQAWQHLRAPNDRNGNPRRVVAVYEIGRRRTPGTMHEPHAYADTVAVIDEGYAGVRGAVERAGYDLRSMAELPPQSITATEYRAMLRGDGLADDVRVYR